MNSFKKIAIVIAAALTSTALVGTPVNAAPSIAYTTMYDTTNGVQVINGLATVTLTTDTSTVTNVQVSGVGNIVLATAGTNTTISVPVQTSGWYQVTTSNVGAGTSTVMLTSAVAGTTTITATPLNPSTGAPGTAVTKTITWTSTGSLAPSASYTTVYSARGIAAPDATTNAVAVVGPMTAQTTAANAVANIKVDLRDSLNNAITNGTLSVTVSGPGFVGLATTQAGAALQGRAVTGTAGQYFINVFGDGTPGVSTITIESGSTVLAKKTFTFSGVAASYAAAKKISVLKVGANAAAVEVTVKDASGNLVADGTTVYASSDISTIATITASATTVSGIATFAVQGISAGSATFTFRNDTTTPTISTTATMRIGSSTVSSVALAFDKIAYVNGEVVKFTLKALDASGLPVADGTYTNLLSEDLISSTQLGGATLAGSKSPVLVDGTSSWNLYAPLSAGPFTVTGKVLATSVALEAKASVADANAASIAALIQSVNAMKENLQVTIDALTAKLAASEAKAKADRAAYVKQYNALAKKWNAKNPRAKIALIK
jgi:hypothetical protein